MFVDPLLAKVMVHDVDRPTAAAKMARVLRESKVQGTPTNIQFLSEVIRSEGESTWYLVGSRHADSVGFLSGATLTNFLHTRFEYKPRAIDVISPGSYTTVQDFPARATNGHGIPKGGPMDNVSSRGKHSKSVCLPHRLT